MNIDLLKKEKLTFKKLVALIAVVETEEVFWKLDYLLEFAFGEQESISYNDYVLLHKLLLNTKVAMCI